MIAQRHLNSAPIKEALIDIRIAAPAELTIEDLAAIPEQLKDLYPNVEVRSKWESLIEFREGKAVEPKMLDHGPTGYFLKTVEGNQVAQFRLDGFTLNRLPPYDCWETFAGEARRLWEIYKTYAKPAYLERVAVRYINKFELPLPLDFDTYLTAGPKVPEALPQTISDFLTRVVVHDVDIGAAATITQTMEPMQPQMATVILDIDAFKISRLDDDRGLWDTLSDLRNFKNRIFFESITEKTAERYQ